MNLMKHLFFSLSLTLICFFTANAQHEFFVHEHGYLSARGVSVLTYHNTYYVGKQGAIEVIQNDKRIITNGMVKYKLITSEEDKNAPEFFSEPIPKTKPIYPQPQPENASILIPIEDSLVGIDYNITIKGTGEGINIAIDFTKLPPKEMIKELSFELELFPSFYRGKSFVFDSGSGFFPLNYYHPVIHNQPQSMGEGRKLTIAPETSELKASFKVENGTMYLYDTRSATNHNCYTLKAVMDTESVYENQFELNIYPNVMENYSKNPVIGYAQPGYHPRQKKEVVIEVDEYYNNNMEMQLLKFDEKSNSFVSVLSEKPVFWGKYNRYDIYTFDFTEIREEGMYYLSLGEQYKTNPFRIAKDIFTGLWEPSLETFIPVQMCHMRIKDRNRIWHGVCHLDDALQAPAPLPFYDGFSQGEKTETPFEPFETIPGLNEGGWHDAGDDDVNTNSTGRTVYHLSLAKEEFDVQTDQTTVDFQNREVYLHRPDSVSDIIQQIKHGLDFILPQYEHIGHSIIGVISSTFETYLIPGTWGHMTDQLFYDPALAPNEKTVTHSGKKDDRFAFTNKDTRSEYRNAYVLAAAYRALKTEDTVLAGRCLEVAESIWETESNLTPVYHKSVGVPNDLMTEKINAAADLYLSIQNEDYLNFIVDNMDYVMGNMEATSWAVARVASDINNKNVIASYNKALKAYADSLAGAFSKNPYHTYLDATLWGYGWDILWRVYKYYYLTAHYPELFPIDPLISSNEFILGKHPYSNVSYVSGVGTGIPIPAFGMNRSDYYYTPGGVFSGVNLVEPDFPELMEDHPFIWQQSEYIIHGASAYIFTILAADKLLNKQ